MKTRPITLLIALGLCAAVFVAVKFRPSPVTPIIVPLAPGFVVDIAGKDVAFHELPQIGRGSYLCLMSKDKVLGFVVSTVEAYDKDWPSFLAHTERGMKAEGGKNIVMGEGVVLKGTPEAEIRRYDLSYELPGGAGQRQIDYMVKYDSDYYSIVVTLFDPAAYDAVRKRTDKLVKAAYITGEYKSQKKSAAQLQELVRTEREHMKAIEAQRQSKP